MTARRKPKPMSFHPDTLHADGERMHLLAIRERLRHSIGFDIPDFPHHRGCRGVVAALDCALTSTSPLGELASQLAMRRIALERSDGWIECFLPTVVDGEPVFTPTTWQVTQAEVDHLREVIQPVADLANASLEGEAAS